MTGLMMLNLSLVLSGSVVVYLMIKEILSYSAERGSKNTDVWFGDV